MVLVLINEVAIFNELFEQKMLIEQIKNIQVSINNPPQQTSCKFRLQAAWTKSVHQLPELPHNHLLFQSKLFRFSLMGK